MFLPADHGKKREKVTSNEPNLSTQVATGYGENEEKTQRLRRFRDDWGHAVLASDVSGAALRVAWLLALEYVNMKPDNPRFGCAWPSKPTVAKEARISLTSVKRAVRELEEAGFLKAVDQLPNRGFQNSGSIVYALRLPGAVDEPGVNHDPGPNLDYPGAVDEPHPGPDLAPYSFTNSLNYSKNFPECEHLAMPRAEGMETFEEFYDRIELEAPALVAYWVELATAYETELTFETALEAAIDTIQDGEDVRQLFDDDAPPAERSSWKSTIMAMMKAIATGDASGEGDNEGTIWDLDEAIERAEEARASKVDHERRSGKTWRWFKGHFPYSQQSTAKEWRFVWETMIYRGYTIDQMEVAIRGHGQRFVGKYPREVLSILLNEPQHEGIAS
ncbi:hypothetical protein HMPREF3048_09665 [Corynebacterium sp. HMSC075D04]|nr:hypothetical protein HMPREF3048_09665 [Corynebacterium sp. HMSC075D04]